MSIRTSWHLTDKSISNDVHIPNSHAFGRSTIWNYHAFIRMTAMRDDLESKCLQKNSKWFSMDPQHCFQMQAWLFKIVDSWMQPFLKSWRLAGWVCTAWPCRTGFQFNIKIPNGTAFKCMTIWTIFFFESVYL